MQYYVVLHVHNISYIVFAGVDRSYSYITLGHALLASVYVVSHSAPLLPSILFGRQNKMAGGSGAGYETTI